MKFAKLWPLLLGFPSLCCWMVPTLVAKNQAPQKPPATAASASPVHVPSGTKVVVKYPDGNELTLGPDEQMAFVFLVSMELLEYSCFNPTYLGRACTLDELIKGFPVKNGGVLGFNQNPNQDPNYRYTLTIADTGDRYQIQAIPQRAGLGGFFCLGKKGSIFGDGFYNPNGVATTTSSKIGNMSISGFDFRRPQF